MSFISRTSILIIVLSSYSFAQDPVSILESHWFRTNKPAPKTEIPASGPARPVNVDDKYFQRKAREARTDNPRDPYDDSIEGRSAAMDRAVQQSRAPQPDDVIGYTYDAEVRNDTGQAVQVIFWEYQFKEIARPENVVRRQFLCGVKIKHGEKKLLSAFSTLAPSDVLTVESLAKPDQKLFEERVRINRIELADGNILQRNDWKYSDLKKEVERATSTPWGKEICRAL
ncbi:MAG: hypothetical protein DMF63_18365 [Acidobacteria bacterium]|nr:MAG: hypothetical protein DMF63_18365 [Acidobacteriota bacterium]